jgi:hypothetical protein
VGEILEHGGWRSPGRNFTFRYSRTRGGGVLDRAVHVENLGGIGVVGEDEDPAAEVQDFVAFGVQGADYEDCWLLGHPVDNLFRF